MNRHAIAIAIVAGLVTCTSPASFAQAPPAQASATPASIIPTPGPVLPFESPLLFVLDNPVSSSNAVVGYQFRAHLRDALVLNGVTLASTGTPVVVRVTGVARAQTGDVDGSLELFFEPLDLGQYGKLPIRAASARVTIVRTAGKQSTGGVADTAGDIFIPGYVLFHALRKGQDVTLPAGTVVRARTTATINAADPQHVFISEPPKINLSVDHPYSSFTPIPFRTPAPTPSPRPKTTPTPTPTPLATPQPIATST